MKYKNAKEILPEHLLKLIQKHIQGEIIYIPKSDKKIGWGEKNGTRALITDRNKAIFDMYQSGHTVGDLIDRYNLSESSIRKILTRVRKECSSTIEMRGACNE